MIQLTEVDQLPSELPKPFSEQVITAKQLKDFISKALELKKQPLVIFGANWCPDAQCLEAIMRMLTVTKFLAQHYEIMRVDVGDYDQNMELYTVFDMPSEEGVPRVVILDLKGRVLNFDSNDRWRTARETDPQEIFNYFQEFANQP
ncbi:MAG: thioredoxin family protein [Porticoccaceae bacterium]|nr:thioredoxin family protein [Porticoccaceae bacterium]